MQKSCCFKGRQLYTVIRRRMGMFKKVITLLFGTAFMVVLMLAAGGIYLLPENFMGAYMYADVRAVL